MSWFVEGTEKKLNDPEWMKRAYSNLSIMEMADHLKCGATTIRKYLIKNGIEIRKNIRRTSKENLILLKDKKWLENQYLNLLKSALLIAKELGCTSAIVYRYLKVHSIKTRVPKISKKSMKLLNDKEWLRHQFIDCGLSYYDISRILKCGSNIVGLRIRKYGIKKEEIGLKITEDARKRLRDKKWLRKQYIDLKRSVYDISNELGCKEIVVRKYIGKCKLKTKNDIDKSGEKFFKDRDWLYDQYVVKKKSIVTLMNMFDIGRTDVVKYLNKHNIEIRSFSIPKESKKLLNDKSWLFNEFITKNRKIDEIAVDLKVSLITVQRQLRKFKFSRNRYIKEKYKKLLESKDWLYDQYITKKKSTIDLAKFIGCSSSAIGCYLIKHKILRRLQNRPISDEALKLLSTKDWLFDQYMTQKKSIGEVANELGLGSLIIRTHMKKYDITIRAGSFVSAEERQISAFIRDDLGIDVKSSDRSILEGKEIDILIPDKNFGIEVNGLYWHSYNPKSRNRSANKDEYMHVNKTMKAKEKGITLIQITDDEWNNRRDQVKNLIRKHLGKCELLSIENMKVTKISKKSSESFFNKNSISEFKPGNSYYGLVYDGLKLCVIFDHKQNLVQYSEEMGYLLPGGLMKIINYLKYDIVAASSDISKEDNFGLISSKFEFIRNDPPEYSWIDGGVKADQSILIKEDQFSSGLDRYSNCGQSIWKYSN